MKWALIPARGGSRGIPRKNIKLLGGKPLIAHSILAAQDSKCFDRIIVSTEDQEIAEVAKQWGAEIRERPTALAEDYVHSVYVVLDCIEHYNMNNDDDIVCMLLPTSPFRISDDICGAMNKFGKNVGSVISVVKCDHTITSFRYIRGGQSLNGDELLNVPVANAVCFEEQRQESGLYVVNGSIYVSSAGLLRKEESFHSVKMVKSYIMPKSRSLDINDEWDWKLAELLMGDRG